MTRHGLLLTLTEPPPGMEEEFNAWYDEEHLPERLSIRGFRSARRWVAECRPGEGKYLATYELDSPAVLDSPEYLAFLNKPTPWTRRCLGKAAVFRRWAMEQASPGNADPRAETQAVVLVCSESPTLGFGVATALQARHFTDPKGKPPHVGLFELREPVLPPGLPAASLVCLYKAYR
jgi:hypothetical protein